MHIGEYTITHALNKGRLKSFKALEIVTTSTICVSLFFL